MSWPIGSDDRYNRKVQFPKLIVSKVPVFTRNLEPSAGELTEGLSRDRTSPLSIAFG